HLRKGEYDQAIADYNKAIEIRPTHAESYYSRGTAYLQHGDCERAIPNFNAAIEFDPAHPSAYNNRAWCYFKTGRAAQGLPDAERSLQLRPNDARHWGHAARSLKCWAGPREPLRTSGAR